MKNHTHAEKWKKITKISLAIFVIALIGGLGLNLAGFRGIAALLGLVELAAMITTFIGASKAIGGLKTGVIALITGAALFIVGHAMLSYTEPSMILGVEFAPLGDPLYIAGYPLRLRGIWLLIIGGIMAAVSYLRRVLKAVENKSPANH